MHNYIITIGNGQVCRGRGWTFEQVLKREFGDDIEIKNLCPIRARIVPTEPLTKEKEGSE